MNNLILGRNSAICLSKSSVAGVQKNLVYTFVSRSLPSGCNEHRSDHRHSEGILAWEVTRPGTDSNSKLYKHI